MDKWDVSDVWKSVAVLVVCVFAAARLDAGLLYEPSNYAAQNNLLLHLDGIRNVGLTKAHDSTAAAWIDLSSSANSAVFGNTTGSGITSAWAADGYTVGGGEYGKLQNTINVGNVFTIQIVCDMTPSEQGSKYPSLFGAADDKCNFYTYNKGTSINFKTVKGSRKEAGGWTGRYVTGLYNKAGQVVFHSASGTVAEGSSSDSVGAQTYYIGGVFKSGDDTYLKERYLNGTIKAIRIYSKVLTTEELTENRAIDEARFFNGIPVTNAVIASAVAGVEANEPGGVYAVDEEGYTFTAPRKTAGSDGAIYACAGYTLETWDAAAGAWSAALRKNATSCRVTDAEKVRITWLWERGGAAMTDDLDPLFHEYVTDGLVLQLDGIRNAGASLAHDYAAQGWVDLAGGKVAALHHDYADGSHWTDDGYFFGGHSSAKFPVQLTGLTNAVTIQAVCEATAEDLIAFKKATSVNSVNWPHLFGCNNNDSLNIYLDINNSTPNNQLTFNNRGQKAQLGKGAWEGRYATAIRNGATNYLFQTATSSGAAKISHALGDIGSLNVRIGGAGSELGYRGQRSFYGTVKAIRVYDRVLTDEELAANRAIDDARFFGAALPVTNVVVASAVRGVSGDEREGAYALSSGGHTFTAPATTTVGNDAYSCTGYTLETWDGATGAWGAPVSHPGELSCALSDTTATVRLTWQWAHTAGPGCDATFNDYATDGLVLHLDGIRNAGVLPVHDDDAATWADLSDSGGYAAFIHTLDDGSSWKRDGYFFGGASRGVMRSSRTLGTAFTIQIVSDVDIMATRRNTPVWPALLGTAETGDPLPVYINLNNSSSAAVNCKVANSNIGIYIYNNGTTWDAAYMTAWSDGVNASVFSTVTPGTVKEFSRAAGTRTITVGSGNGSSGGYDVRYLTGTIKTVRIYNRALTDAELAQNRAADETRFFGRAGQARGELVVASTVEGLAGELPAGAYRPAAGYVFSAPETAVLDGTPYELAGYTLETWDAAEGAWSAPVAFETCSYASDVSSASRRLTWQWRVKSRLTRIRDDYDTGDYVQNGLYLHFDGIRNVGADADHDSEADGWTNLVSSSHAAFDYANDGAASSGWTTNGYHFTNGGKFAKLATNLNFGASVTIQAVCDVPESERSLGGTWPSIFGATNDFCNIYTEKNAFNLVFKTFNNAKNSGGRMEVKPAKSWDGRYLTAIWHKGYYTIFYEGTPPAANWAGKQNGNTADSFQGRPFYIGGVYFDGDAGDTNARRLCGTIHALRVYTRALQDEELAHNRKVDEARFFGKLSDWNVQVAMGKYDASCEAVGYYLVEGAYTFTAGAATTPSGGHRSVVGYTVEPWDETNGVWGAPVPGNGDSYTYTAGTSPAKVRLTWKWRTDGAVLLIR